MRKLFIMVCLLALTLSVVQAKDNTNTKKAAAKPAAVAKASNEKVDTAKLEKEARQAAEQATKQLKALTKKYTKQSGAMEAMTRLHQHVVEVLSHNDGNMYAFYRDAGIALDNVTHVVRGTGPQEVSDQVRQALNHSYYVPAFESGRLMSLKEIAKRINEGYVAVTNDPRGPVIQDYWFYESMQ